MMILAMLEEGKISSEEASKLIEALDEAEMKEYDNSINFNKADQEISSTNTTKIKNKSKNKTVFLEKDTRGWEEKFEEKMENFGKKIEQKFGKDFEEKMEKRGEEFGEKMSKFGENIAEGTLSFTDKIMNMVENIVDNGNFGNVFGSYETIEENLEKDISQSDISELVFEAVNGKISIKPWNKDTISVKAICNIKKKNANIKKPIYTVIEEKNVISFKPLYTSNIGTKLYVNIPKKDYQKIKISTTNGKIQGEDITAQDLVFNTTNSSIVLSTVKADDLYLNTKNGRILVDNITSKRLSFNTSNATISLEDSSCQELDAITKNAKISLENSNCAVIKAKTTNGPINIDNCIGDSINASTSNSKITINNIDTATIKDIFMKTTNSSIEALFNNTKALFSIDATTSMGHIDVNVPNLVYDLNDLKQLGSKKILAHSADYSEDNGIKVVATTSNGSIKIG